MLTLERLIPSREVGARQNAKVRHTPILHEILFPIPKYKSFFGKLYIYKEKFCTQVKDKSIFFASKTSNLT